MKEEKTSAKPDFDLMKQSDITSFYHMQMPRWLFFDERYKSLPLESKVAYTFLLNRFQLSKLNGWINENGEVFIIYTRKSLAAEMQVSYRKIIESMRHLAEAGLTWERRCGRGDANRIYLARLEFSSSGAEKHASAPFVQRTDEGGGCATHVPVSRSAQTALQKRSAGFSGSERGSLSLKKQSADSAVHEKANAFKKCENDTSKGAVPAVLDMQDPHTSNKDIIYIKKNQSVSPDNEKDRAGPQFAELSELDSILKECDLWFFDPETANVFENAIERLYFMREYSIGGAVLPQAKVRTKLKNLNLMMLREAEKKISANTGKKIQNSTAYAMAVIFNSISETESDVMLNPLLNSINQICQRR